MANKVLHVHDSLLGYVPRAGFSGVATGGVPVTIDTDGFRSNGGPLASTDVPILAVGDSYTYGEDVGDTETWPAQLQRLTGGQVLNGGVSGYGFDQIVLRAEQLGEIHKPSVVIVSLIADDVRRTEMRRMWWHDKPWFAIEDDQLVLKGVPVPNQTMLPLQVQLRMELGLIELPLLLQHLLGYHTRIHPAGVGPTIALLLTERLARWQAERHVRIVMMAQYDPRAWINSAFADEQRRVTHAILNCAAANGIATLDTFQRLAAEPRPREFYGAAHMNARGNLMIASLLTATLPGLLNKSA